MPAIEGGHVLQTGRFTRLLMRTVICLAGVLAQAGCTNDSPPPQRMPVPSAGNRDQSRERDYVRPMPPEDWRNRPASDPRPDDTPHPRP
jgi:hypothetical protein